MQLRLQFLLHHADTLPRPEAANVIHSVLLRGQRHYLLGKAGGGGGEGGRRGGVEGYQRASALHHVAIYHNVTQLHACRDCVCVCACVRHQVREQPGSLPHQEVITTSP